MAARNETLTEYNRRRDFTRTKEPKGTVARRSGNRMRFLVQKHAATRLHYDFRLEWEGVLKSWAVTRGPSLNPEDKRLAVRTEDHPLAYGDFEGTIPKGEYGGGTVMLWDTGWWEPEDDPSKALRKGKLSFKLHGSRMKGGWALVRMRPREGEKRENWLLVKETDEIASKDGESLINENITSVVTGRTMEEIAEGRGEKRSRVWHSNKSTAANLRAGAVAEDGNARKRPTRKPSGKLPTFRAPQLATLVTQVPVGDAWLNEAKFDGYRLVCALGGGTARCYTRNGLDWTEKFPVIAAALAELDCRSALIDGEVVALSEGGSTFSALQKALATGASTRLYAFDLIELDGKDLSRKPLVERKEKLEALLQTLGTTSTIQFSEHVRGNGEHVLAAICKAGQEGIIAKEANAPLPERAHPKLAQGEMHQTPGIRHRRLQPVGQEGARLRLAHRRDFRRREADLSWRGRNRFQQKDDGGPRRSLRLTQKRNVALRQHTARENATFSLAEAGPGGRGRLRRIHG